MIYVIVGGGIAGVGQYTEQFEVNEDEVVSEDPRFLFIQAEVVRWDYKKKVLTIRDTESAEQLQRRLHGAKRVAVVGNGGIATEIVFEIKGVHVTWIIRDDSISSVFFNPAIADFFQKRVESGRQEGAKNAGVLKRPRYGLDDFGEKNTAASVAGCALGPDWISSLSFKEAKVLFIFSLFFDRESGRSVSIIRNVEVQKVADVDDGLKLSLSNGIIEEDQFVQCIMFNHRVVGAVLVGETDLEALLLFPFSLPF
ncbi:hypothetical protein TELCIR_03928 [Teladorsagia circumcincta]|uniref:Pyridine nucleotide-disulfide oxidoreductase n=1 Tax=Teladorsagia circumcincta TaxID=45464 RepID=A0A2G9UUY4_TELCI|nr:hypothetical protein TELCIR_03928 [Teladorsagia circumcincta]